MRSLFQFLTSRLSEGLPFALTAIFLFAFPWCPDTESPVDQGSTNAPTTRDANFWLAHIARGRASMYVQTATYILCSTDGAVDQTVWYSGNRDVQAVYERLGSPVPLWNLVTDPQTASLVYQQQQARFWRAVSEAVGSSVFPDYKKAAYGHDAAAIALTAGKDYADDFLKKVASAGIPVFDTFYDSFISPLTSALGYMESAAAFARAAEEMTGEFLRNTSLGLNVVRVNDLWMSDKSSALIVLERLADLHDLAVEETNYWDQRQQGKEVTQQLKNNLTQQKTLLMINPVSLRHNFFDGKKNLWFIDVPLWQVYIDNPDPNNNRYGILDGIPDESFLPAQKTPRDYFTGVQEAIRSFLTADGSHIQACLAYLASDINPEAGLVAYYPFNGDANDASGQGHHGIVYGPVMTSDRFGRPNHAYSFDGINDYIRISGSTNMNYANICVSAWVRLSELVGATQARIICKQVTNGGAESWGIEIFGNGYSGSNNTNKFTFHSANCVVNRNLVSPRNLTAGTWYHVVAINDGKNLRLYVNGTLDTSISSVGNTCTNNSAAIVIGKTSPINQFYFPGAIDDIRIYSRVLSESEIETLHHEGGWAD